MYLRRCLLLFHTSAPSALVRYFKRYELVTFERDVAVSVPDIPRYIVDAISVGVCELFTCIRFEYFQIQRPLFYDVVGQCHSSRFISEGCQPLFREHRQFDSVGLRL